MLNSFHTNLNHKISLIHHMIIKKYSFIGLVFGIPYLGLWIFSLSSSLFIATFLATALVIILMILLEYRYPFNAQWTLVREKFKQAKTQLNFLHWISSFIFQEFISKLLIVSFVIPFIAYCAASNDIVPWVNHWPLIAQIVLLFLITDFFNYWLHRCMHRWYPGWVLHRIHHSLDELNWSSSARLHPLEHIINAGPRYCILFLISPSHEVILVYLLITNCHGLLIHSNIAFATEWLDPYFYTANHHRYHHAVALQESNANFSGPTLIWDKVFGTLYLPNTSGPKSLGLASEDPIAKILNRHSSLLSLYIELFISPFKLWYKQIKKHFYLW